MEDAHLQEQRGRAECQIGSWPIWYMSQVITVSRLLRVYLLSIHFPMTTHIDTFSLSLFPFP